MDKKYLHFEKKLECHFGVVLMANNIQQVAIIIVCMAKGAMLKGPHIVVVFLYL